jgi:nucleoside 2-deoxyribosyltransferase
MNVYLAGPITGQSYKGATEWRQAVIRDLALKGIVGYSPMRAKSALDGMRDLSAWDYPDDGPLSGRAMYHRDLHDVRRADVILANFVGATQISVGTIYEMGYAKALNIPVIVAMEEGNPHKHIFVTNGADLICPDLREALAWIMDVLFL